MDTGFIRLSRKFFENRYWTKKRCLSQAEAWLDLIQMARFEAEPAKVILQSRRELLIERGEIHASLRFLAKRWGWGVMQVRTFLKKAMLSHEITQRITQGENIIILCNYDKYNPVMSGNNTPDNTPITHRQHTDNTNNNKENNVNKEKESKEKIKKENFDFSFLDQEFSELFFDWLEYKGSKNQKYANQKSLEACYRNLKKLSGGRPEMARQIVDQSMANSYSGLFELKTNKHDTNSRIFIPEGVDYGESTIQL